MPRTHVSLPPVPGSAAPGWPVRVLVLLLACVQAGLAAGGTILGRVSAAGEPLAGAHVQVVDARQGAATGLDGEFVLLGLAPGPLTLRISHLGYASQEHRVFVASNHSTRLEADLSSAPIQADSLVVRAQRPLTPLTATSSQNLVDQRRLQASPIHDFQALLATVAGVHRDEGGGLHIRGGRRGEVAVIQNGLSLADPVDGEFLAVLNEDRVSELVVETGSFSARWGDALSGVVRITGVRRVPRPEIGFRWRSPNLADSPWRQARAYGVEESGVWHETTAADRMAPEPSAFRLDSPGRLQLKLGLPASRAGADLVLTALSEREDSHLPFGWRSQGDLGLALGRDLPGGGRLQLDLGRQAAEQQSYSHAWKYLPEHRALSVRHASHASLGLQLNHGPRAISAWRLSVLDNRRRVGVRPGEDWLALADYRRPVYLSQQDFYGEGHDPRLGRHHNLRWELAVDGEWRQTPVLALAAGVELRHNRFERDQWSLVFGDGAAPDTALSLHEIMDRQPRQGALWLEQKVELDWLVLDLGLRLDAFDPDARAWADPETLFDPQGGLSPLEEVDPWTVLSPRLGLAFPVDEATVMHASYGQFVQFPDLDALYTNPERRLDHSSVPLLGYGGLKPQQTTAFELGLKRRGAPGRSLELTAWHKDIRNLLSTSLGRQFTREFVVYTNHDHGSVLGLDLALRLPLGRRSRMAIDYTVMHARGSGSSKSEGYEAILAGGEIEVEEFPLDFDQRHDISSQLELDLPHGFSATLLAEVASGLPYTPFVDLAVDTPRNSALKPWTRRLDASLAWRRDLGPVQLGLRLEGENLLDTRNVVEVFASSGDPYTDSRNLIGNTEDSKHDPSHVGAPRALRLGLELKY
jgi:outer membrane receptor protein involved in Fe transport